MGLEDPASWGGSGAEGLSPVTHGQLLHLPLPTGTSGLQNCVTQRSAAGDVFSEAWVPASIIFHWGRGPSYRSGSSYR